MTDYVEKGVENARIAVTLDEEEKHKDALAHYLKALTWFEMELKHGKNESTKHKLRLKMESYMDRAEQIKTHLKTEKPQADAGADGADDKDEQQLIRMIEDTILSTSKGVRWEDVAGLDEAKKSLKEAIILPIEAPHLFKDGTKTWKGILLYGPPGTGKSYIATAVATEADSTFFSLSASKLISKWVGQSERLVRTLFEVARDRAPSIIFIDEIEALLTSRSAEGTQQNMARVVAEFLAQLDGVGNDQKGVVIIGATNLPWLLDAAVLRQGRFDRKIYIPLPDPNARTTLFQIHSHETLTKDEMEQLIEITDGYSGSDVAGVCKAAHMRPLRILQEATHFKLNNGRACPCAADDPDAVCMSWEAFEDKSILDKPNVEFADYMQAVQQTKPSTNHELMRKYTQWTNDYGLE